MTWDAPEAERVADGVYRLPLPLPGNALRAVNVYALASETGITLVDSGWHDRRTAQALTGLLGEVGLRVDDVTTVLVTHLHGDHVGQAASLRLRTGARIWLGRGERIGLYTARQGLDARLADRDAHLRRCGARDLVRELHRVYEEPGDLGWELPDQWVQDGTELDLGHHRLRAVETPGHTRGHVSFLTGSGLLFAGDHILPHITPSIGFELHADGTALAAFLSSLTRVRALPVEQVLPAHGSVFTDLPGRVDELLAHHEERLMATRQHIGLRPRTAYQVAQQLPWTRRETPFARLDVFSRMLATWETAAHLELLRQRGQIRVAASGPESTFVAPDPGQ